MELFSTFSFFLLHFWHMTYNILLNLSPLFSLEFGHSLLRKQNHTWSEFSTVECLYSFCRSLDGLQDQRALQAPRLKKNAQETDFVKLKCKEYEKINKELEVNVNDNLCYDNYDMSLVCFSEVLLVICKVGRDIQKVARVF